jgi:hypothetical protein
LRSVIVPAWILISMDFQTNRRRSGLPARIA